MLFGNFIDEDLKQKLENPTQYYLDHIHDEKIMLELAGGDIEYYQYILRLDFIDKMSNHEHIYQCPECQGNIITDIWGEEYCEKCGLVTRTHYPYVASQRITLDYGLK